MSNDVNSPPSAPVAPTPPSAAPLGAPEAPKGLKSSGLKFESEADVPSWAQGKTAKEVLEIAKTLHATVQRGTPQAAPSAPVATPAPSATPGRRVDSNLVYRDADAYTEQLLSHVDQMVEARLANASGSFAAPVASMARAQAMSHKPEIWSKYAPEIDALMSEVQGPARLNVDLWKRAVNMVASEHLDELVYDATQAAISRGDTGGLRGGGGAPLTSSPNASSPIRALFAANDPAIASFKDAGLNAEAVIEHYRKMGKDEAKAAETLKNAASRRLRIA